MGERANDTALKGLELGRNDAINVPFRRRRRRRRRNRRRPPRRRRRRPLALCIARIHTHVVDLHMLGLYTLSSTRDSVAP